MVTLGLSRVFARRILNHGSTTAPHALSAHSGEATGQLNVVPSPLVELPLLSQTRKQRLYTLFLGRLARPVRWQRESFSHNNPTQVRSSKESGKRLAQAVQTAGASHAIVERTSAAGAATPKMVQVFLWLAKCQYE
jgi:hypothetical protein